MQGRLRKTNLRAAAAIVVVLVVNVVVKVEEGWWWRTNVTDKDRDRKSVV